MTGSGLPALLRRPQLPGRFERWEVRLAPGEHRVITAPDWTDALVLVTRGRLVVDGTDGTRETFVAGDLLPLGALPVRRLHNPGDASTLLVAVRRRDP